MNNLQSDPFLTKAQFLAFSIGLLFLITYWFYGYDGITFSDDVYYLLAGKKFWEGTMEVNDYHFSSRWGAYVPSGFIGYLFGFEAHRISLISLLSYALCLLALIIILPKSAPAWVLVLWLCTQIYSLHFLTKVYPDSILFLWTSLIPVAATYRNNNPILAGGLIVLAMFIGFLTKETIVLLIPFPILIFYFDWKRKSINSSFYLTALLTSAVLITAYLGYFWIAFGDPLHRINSINAGHYISEFTYADKGFYSMLRRLTVLPIITFVERSYWAWIVFALPGIFLGFKSKKTPAFEFSLASLCLLIGFWFMTSTLDFYNPIYLNPRHLIIIVPILSMLIALGWTEWQNSKKWKLSLTGLLLLGTAISLFQMDLKMATFNLLLAGGIWFSSLKIYWLLLTSVLLAPACFAIAYQHKLKQYPLLISTLYTEIQSTGNQSIMISNNFIEFSDQILFPNDIEAQEKLHGLDFLLDKKNLKTDSVTIFLYPYYKHAYPQEQEEINRTIHILESSGYKLTAEENTQVMRKLIYIKD